MNVLVFNIIFWDNQSQADLLRPIYKNWIPRIQKYCPNQGIYISTGNYSNPKYNPTQLPLIQLGIERQINDIKPRLNYFKAGMFGALYYFLLNYHELNWDIVAFIHYSVLLGENLKPHLDEFMDRPEKIMAPQFITPLGNYIETAMLFMKNSAVKKWIINGSIKDIKYPDGSEISIESEVSLIFNEFEWFNPFCNVSSIRYKNMVHIPNKSDEYLKCYTHNENSFTDLPFIYSLAKHTPPYLVDKWKKKHPMEITE